MNEILINILLLSTVALLTAGTFICVAAEFALTSLERSTIDAHVAEVGDKRAKLVQQAHKTLSFQLSGAQLGITLTTVTTGFLAQPAIGDLIDPLLSGLGLPSSVATGASVALALIMATSLSMLFGELVPKNLAIARPLETARAVTGIYSWFTRIFRWVINVANNGANALVRRLGVEPADELRSARSPEELGSMVRSSAEQGTMDAGTASLLDRSLRFGDRTAGELMTPRVRIAALTAESTAVDLLEIAHRTGFSRFPVHGGDLDDVRGVVHVKQAFTLPSAARAATLVSSLARPVPSVPDSLEGDALLDRLRGSGLQLALVVDEYGGTAGLVSFEDVIEEIIGDVRDEHDRREISPIRPMGEQTWVASGLLRDDELAEATGLQIPEGDYDTLAGFVLDRLGRIPDVADEVRLDGWLLTVLRMDRRRIAELRVARVAEAGDSEDVGEDRTAVRADVAHATADDGERGVR
ncbi:CBS domain containing-hemolysin-like protein [Actinoalloteichus hoggarensis]|uniref:Magnesium and cobalt efflux protein CorC n=1 Tax=Actinoalloteichus hoggarensis TaxID=1470176 RepID=A0A221W1S5_9PSEU|nr:hemolysin family protein [Actinoalloteichus hoggarensis]ASO19795.1 Magnesium and cobalt efflux protein CorC [Actinoalloteichus hoggarensis]MBB5919498.1 CBS domain containing-hemolysin-like protein [Actinoalloteichus hoggarensis]